MSRKIAGKYQREIRNANFKVKRKVTNVTWNNNVLQ